MKKNIITIGAAIAVMLAVTSCKQSLYQVYTVESDNVETNELYMSQKNSDIELNYYLWADHGNPGFLITNKTDKIVYVDLSKSFFTINGMTQDYYLNREWTSSKSLGATKSAESSASASATLHGSLYYNFSKYNGPVTGTVSNGISESLSYLQSKGMVIKEKDVVAIPPHSSKIVAEYIIVTSALSNCALNTTSVNEASQTYTKEQTPYNFSNYISYRVEDGAEQAIESNFWVSKIQNVKESNEILKKTINMCGDKVTTTSFRDNRPNKFYITLKDVKNKPDWLKNNHSTQND